MLSRFHSCGVKAKNVTLGVPRIKELIDLTKNMKTPTMRLVLKKEFTSISKQIQSKIVNLSLADIVQSLAIVREPCFFDSDISDTDKRISQRLRKVMTEPSQFCPWIGRIELASSIIVEKSLTPAQIACILERAFPLHVSASQETDANFILRLRPRCVLSGTTEHAAGSVEEDEALKALTEGLILRVCREMVLRGIKSIVSAAVINETLYSLDDQGDVTQEEVTVIETQGSGLASVLALPDFRSDLCTSNDIHNVHAVLGIEAAASVLFDQIRQTLTFDGSYTNERHLMLLCSFCTAQSTLLPISRHGINRSADSGALSRASFEEVTDQLLEAAAYGDLDYTTAFSPAIMVGQRAANTGTGICHAISNHKPQEEEISSDDDVVFTSIDADVEMLSYHQDLAHTEAPYHDAGGGGMGIPPALQHSYITAVSRKKDYVPSSPKAIGHKFLYSPSSPKGQN